MKFGIPPLIVLSAQAFLVQGVQGQTRTVRVDRVAIRYVKTHLGVNCTDILSRNVSNGTFAFNIGSSCSTADIGTITLTFPSGDLTGTVNSSGGFKLTSPSSAPFSIAVSSSISNKFIWDWHTYGYGCFDPPKACQVDTLDSTQFSADGFEAGLQEDLKLVGDSEYSITIWFASTPASGGGTVDLGDPGFTPDDPSAGSCKAPTAAKALNAAAPSPSAAGDVTDTLLPKMSFTRRLSRLLVLTAHGCAILQHESMPGWPAEWRPWIL